MDGKQVKTRRHRFVEVQNLGSKPPRRIPVLHIKIIRVPPGSSATVDGKFDERGYYSGLLCPYGNP